MNRTRLLLLFACLNMLPAHAAQVIELTMEDLNERADVIVLATIVDITAEWPKHNPRRIQTRVQGTVTEVLKAPIALKAMREITFVVPGGEIGRIGQRVPGAPRFMRADEALLHLRYDPFGQLQVVGLSQGVHKIDRTSAPNVAIRDNSGVHYVVPSRTQHRSHRPTLERVPLEPLLDTVRRYVSRVKP